MRRKGGRGEREVRSAIIRGEKTGTKEKIILGNLLSALAADLPLPSPPCLFRMQARYGTWIRAYYTRGGA